MAPTSSKRNKREIAKAPRRKKSSRDARRFIDAAIRRCGNERKAAEQLGLPNHGQLHKMRAGTLCDTPAMRAYIATRKARAQRAAKRAYNKSYYNLKDTEQIITSDIYSATLRDLRRDAEELISRIDMILKTAS